LSKDIIAAYKWVRLSSAQGYTKATKTLPQIELEMTTDQIAEAQHLVRQFKPHPAGESNPGELMNPDGH
jgi:hypothetical protein